MTTSHGASPVFHGIELPIGVRDDLSGVVDDGVLDPASVTSPRRLLPGVVKLKHPDQRVIRCSDHIPQSPEAAGADRRRNLSGSDGHGEPSSVSPSRHFTRRPRDTQLDEHVADQRIDVGTGSGPHPPAGSPPPTSLDHPPRRRRGPTSAPRPLQPPGLLREPLRTAGTSALRAESSEHDVDLWLVAIGPDGRARNATYSARILRCVPHVRSRDAWFGTLDLHRRMR
jgi:hypothetical protein